MSQRKRKATAKNASCSIKKFFTAKSSSSSVPSSVPSVSVASSPALASPVISSSVSSSSVSSSSVASSSVASSSNKHSSGPSYEKWIKLKGFDESLQMNVFTLHADGGILCLLCSKHVLSPRESHRNTPYISVPARPQRLYRLERHLESELHMQSVTSEQSQRSSVFHTEHQQRVANKRSTVADRVVMIYWILKEEIANMKVPSLQRLVDRVGRNSLLRDFKHLSSTADRQDCTAIGVLSLVAKKSFCSLSSCSTRPWSSYLSCPRSSKKTISISVTSDLHSPPPRQIYLRSCVMTWWLKASGRTRRQYQRFCQQTRVDSPRMTRIESGLWWRDTARHSPLILTLDSPSPMCLKRSGFSIRGKCQMTKVNALSLASLSWNSFWGGLESSQRVNMGR